MRRIVLSFQNFQKSFEWLGCTLQDLTVLVYLVFFTLPVWRVWVGWFVDIRSLCCRTTSRWVFDATVELSIRNLDEGFRDCIDSCWLVRFVAWDCLPLFCWTEDCTVYTRDYLMNLDNVCVILPISGNTWCIPTLSSNIKLDRVSRIFTINIKDFINCPRGNTRRQLQFRFSSIMF